MPSRWKKTRWRSRQLRLPCQFGSDTIAVSAVGNDRLGDETIASLEAKGLKYMMPRVSYPTGTVQVTLDDNGIPTYDIRENVAWDNIPFSPELEELAHNCRAVCWGSLAQRNVDLRYQPSSELLHEGGDQRVD